jgi:hypothetical protein
MQELIKKAELSDKIFNALSDAYALAVKRGDDEAEQRRVLLTAAGFEKQWGNIPSGISTEEMVEIFFNRL